MVNSRQKGKIGQKKVLQLLTQKTGLPFQYTPGSGNGVLKGDIHFKGCKFCIQIKNYAQSPFNDKILTNKSNIFVGWWNKLKGQSGRKRPLLIFKYNRSKLFVCTDIKPTTVEKYIDIPYLKCYVMLLQEWIQKEEIIWQ